MACREPQTRPWPLCGQAIVKYVIPHIGGKCRAAMRNVSACPAAGLQAMASAPACPVAACATITPPGRASGRGDAGVYTDRRKRPHGAVLRHSCTLLRRCGQTWGQECTQIGKNDLSAPFWGTCVHCCDASCDASRVGWHECLNHHDVPAAPPRWPPPPWSEKQALHERSRR